MVSHAQCTPSAAGREQCRAGSGLCSGGYGGRQGSGAQREGTAEGSAERTTPSSATPMVLHIVGENNIIGSRHFQSLEEAIPSPSTTRSHRMPLGGIGATRASALPKTT